MSTEISFHKVTKVSIDSMRKYDTYSCIVVRIHSANDKTVELTLYSATENPVAVQFGEEV